MILVNFEKEMPGCMLRAAIMLDRARTTILFGESGSGKTTLLDCIAGLRRPDRGEITIEGCSVYSSLRSIDLPPQERQVGYVFQHYALFPHMTAQENVAFAIPHAPEEEVRAMLERLHIGHLAGRKPADMSGGERQRLALARALATRPRMLLMDEPFSALDRYTKEEVYQEFLALRDALGMCVLLVTHDHHEAELLGHRIHRLRDGLVVE